MESKLKLLIDACFICRGGGLTVLRHFIKECKNFSSDIVVVASKDITCDATIVRTSYLARQITISPYRRKGYCILNISNVPYWGWSNYLLLVHQRYYTDPNAFDHLATFREAFLLFLKRTIFALALRRRVVLLFQTQTMAAMLRRRKNPTVIIKTYDGQLRVPVPKEKRLVLAISDPAPHKMLSPSGHRILELLRHGYRVIIVGECIMPALAFADENLDHYPELPYDDLQHLFCRAEFVLTPSSFESLGLIFIEAALNHCKLIAPRSDVCSEVIEEYADLYSPDMLSDLAGLPIAKLRHPTPPVIQGYHFAAALRKPRHDGRYTAQW